jgi:high affinity sulfate transporter 1
MATKFQDQQQSKSLLKSYLPILTWLPQYNRSWLRPDVIAGLTVVALLVPEGMAYAELAGLPPETAFYAAPAGLILYAIFGTSRQLVVAVSATIAVMSAATVSGLAPPDSMEFIMLSAALAMLAGLISVVAGLLRFGRIAQFFSESVLTGFVFGLALVIAIKQVPKLFGLEAVEGNFFERVIDITIHLPETHLLTLLIGGSSLILMIVLEKRFPRLPAALVTMIYGIVVVSIFNLEALNIHIVGDIPSGLAAPRLPDFSLSDLDPQDLIVGLLPGAFGIALVAFAEAVGPARQFAAKYRYRVDADQELIGLGMANFGAGLFQGFPIGASLSKSAANDNAGAKTAMSLIIAAAVTALVALFFTPLFRNLPEATLAAIVVVAIAGMMRVGEMKRLYRLNKVDFALAMIALFGVLIFEVLAGLFIAVIISLLVLIARTSAPKLSVLGRSPDKLDFGDVRRHPENRTLPGLLVIRPNEGLFFANASSLSDTINELVQISDPPAKAVLLDLEMTFELDVPSADALAELKKDLERADVALLVTRVHGEVRDMLDHSGVTDKIGAENFYPYIIEGVFAYLRDNEEAAEYARGIAANVRDLIAIVDLAAEQADETVKLRLQSTRERLLAVNEVIDPDQ